RPSRAQVHLPRHAHRHGRRHRLHRPDPDVRADRPHCCIHPVRSAHDPGSVPGRGVWRMHYPFPRAPLRPAAGPPHPAGSEPPRGYYTVWLQASPTLGIVVSLAVIIATRTYFGSEVFDAWAWRVPFLVSFLLVAIAIYIRLQLQETPIFEEIKAKGQMTRN